jgi:hypothetical protein
VPNRSVLAGGIERLQHDKHAIGVCGERSKACLQIASSG